MKNLEYSDVTLIHKKGIVKSRSECNTSISFGGKQFKLPVIPANMKCCIDFEIAEYMSESGYFYILHRFYDYREILEWMRKRVLTTYSISVGVKEGDYRFLENIVSENLPMHFLTIDVAFAYSEHVIKFVKFIKNELKLKSTLIVGNVGTQDAVKCFEDLGVDAVKVGIGSGKACSTSMKTGFSTPMFSTIWNICNTGYLTEYTPSCKIIADGGIRHNGDIAKALVAGADMVMVGGMFAACQNSPAENIFIEGYTRKKYYGSASPKNKGNKTHIEGFETILKCNEMTYCEKLKEIEEDLQSAISYAGGKDLKAFYNLSWES